MSLTNKTLGGFVWAFLERFGAQALQLVVFVILARMISPEAFGLIGMLAVFIAISRSITDSGFGQALIQKKNTDEVDYSSVFYINLVTSFLMYVLLFISAPYISSFYNEPELTTLVRVLGIRFVIAAFSMVQIAKLTKEVRFKEIMMAKLPSTFLGGVAGIVAAYSGFGVWSLVIQQLTDASAYSLQIWVQSKWVPKLIFEWSRIKSLFNFGSKIMIDSVLSTVYQNLYELIIGRYYSAAQVGFYTQANKIKQLPVQNISSALGRVTFPILAGIQDDDERLKSGYKKIVRLIFLIITPVMVTAIVIAEPLFRFVLTEKWLPAVPYFQWLCINGMLYPVLYYNQNILKVKGRSDLLLYIGLLKKGIALIGIFVFIQYSVLALVIYRAFHGLVAYFINSYYCGKFINYGVFEQIKDVSRILLASLISGIFSWLLLSYFSMNDPLTIIIGTIIGFTIYGVIIYIIEYPIVKYSKNTATNFIAKI